jgi:hypothetical protein
LLQCAQTGIELRIAGTFRIDLLLRAATLFFDCRILLLGLFKLMRSFFQRSVFFFQLQRQITQMRVIR